MAKSFLNVLLQNVLVELFMDFQLYTIALRDDLYEEIVRACRSFQVKGRSVQIWKRKQGSVGTLTGWLPLAWSRAGNVGANDKRICFWKRTFRNFNHLCEALAEPGVWYEVSSFVCLNLLEQVIVCFRRITFKCRTTSFGQCFVFMS